MEGSESEGAETRKIYLVDFEIEPYSEHSSGCPEELSRLCEEAEAIVLGAPVYWADINGLTKDFMDTEDLQRQREVCPGNSGYWRDW